MSCVRSCPMRGDPQRVESGEVQACESGGMLVEALSNRGWWDHLKLIHGTVSVTRVLVSGMAKSADQI